MNRHPDNITIDNKYLGLKAFIDQENLKRRTAYEYERIQSAAGDDRKIWKIYKEILFNQDNKLETDITINGTVVLN